MFRAFTLVAVIGSGVVSSAVAADWILAPSTYTHDPQTGRRVTQYAPIEPVVVPTRPDYIKSGYRHNRSSIYSGNGADHHYVVEQWGRPVRPYGEWLYPYRPYSVPYQFWGAPYAGLGYPYVYGAPGYGGVRGPGGHPGALDGEHEGRRFQDDARWWIRDPHRYENYHPDLLPRRDHGGFPPPPHEHAPDRYRDRGGASGPTGYGESGAT